MEQVLNVWNIQEQLLKSKVIKIYGQVTDKMAYEVNACLDVLSNDDPSAIIKLEICTPGGSVLAGLAICDKIKSIPNPVVAINTGMCMSMGTIISSACDYALATPHAYFMIHECSGGEDGKFRDRKVALEFSENLNKETFSILTKKTGKDYETLLNSAVYDLYMSPKQALDFGLIDGIISPVEKNSEVLDSMNTFVKKLESGKILD